MNNQPLSDQQKLALLSALRNRFSTNIHRHPELEWPDVEARLEKNPDKLLCLQMMEETGGEPDVTGLDGKTGQFVFCDCSKETPKGRRSICYDHEALVSRKENKPADSALGMAARMGIEILGEEEYRSLQRLESFDTKTSSWVLTPENIRSLGGALFCDRRYDTVFVYHNGAESYYSSRGFRGLLKV